MFCAISGNIPQEPVVTKTGQLFERSLIEKHIDAEGTCPITKEPLTKEDLIPVQSSKIVKPRPATATSVPGLLSIFQNEWDALMLETYTLKQHLETVRMELSHALYQQDASARVIARLLKERDQARSSLSQLRAQFNVKESEEMDVDTGTDGVATKTPKEIIPEITKTAQTLAKVRKTSRTISPTLCPAETISAFAVASTHKVHPKGAVSCVAVHPSQASKVVTGGEDNIAVVFDSATKKKRSVLSGHEGAVTAVAFHGDSVLTTSRDATAGLWTSQNGSDYSLVHKFTVHGDAVTGLSIHATNKYFATVSLDRSWALHDIEAQRTLCQVRSVDPDPEKYSCVAFHPDGLILGTGTCDQDLNGIRIWDVKRSTVVANFSGHTADITSLSFSENGYHLATASLDGSVRLWDLRKLKAFQTIEIGSPVNSVSFDYSGLYLAVGSSNVRVFAAKTWNELLSESSHSDAVTSVCFGPDANVLVSGSRDKTVKMYSAK